MHYVPMNQQTIIEYWIAANDYASLVGNTKERSD